MEALILFPNARRRAEARRPGLLRPADPVSYTHLDVYKRQVVYRGGDLTFVWVHKALAAFGSQVVFLAGIGVAAGMTFGAWRVIRAQRKLPDTVIAEGKPA